MKKGRKTIDLSFLWLAVVERENFLIIDFSIKFSLDLSGDNPAMFQPFPIPRGAKVN